MSNAVQLGGYLIYCSDICHQRAEEKEDLERDLRATIDSLTDELKGKDLCIQRLRRDSKTFENVASEAEDKLTAELEKQNKRIHDLKCQLKALKKNNEDLLQQLKEQNLAHKKLNQDYEESSRLSRNMVVTIDTLERTNDMYLDEIKTIKQTVERLELELAGRNKEECKCIHDCNLSKKGLENLQVKQNLNVRPQLLVLGNNIIRGTNFTFKSSTKKKYDVNCQWRNSLPFKDLVSEFLEYGSKLSKKDCVVLFVGQENALGGTPIDAPTITKLIKASQCTNLLLVGPPQSPKRPVLNDFVAEQNKILEHHFRNSIATFLPLNFTTTEHLRYPNFKHDFIARLCHNFINKISEIRSECRNHDTTGDNDIALESQKTPVPISEEEPSHYPNFLGQTK